MASGVAMPPLTAEQLENNIKLLKLWIKNSILDKRHNLAEIERIKSLYDLQMAKRRYHEAMQEDCP